MFLRTLKLKMKYTTYLMLIGQYVFIRIPAVGLLEFHPFSISSYPGSGNTFSVHIKSSVASANGWTSRLMKFMKEHENKPEHYKDISVQIEGPFGELTLRKELSRYEHVVFIGGGIGVTPLDSMYNQLVTDLLDNNIRRTAKTRKIDFIFTTRSRSLITEFASRNKAWEFYAKTMQNGSSPTQGGPTQGGDSKDVSALQVDFQISNFKVDKSLSTLVETNFEFRGPQAILREVTRESEHAESPSNPRSELAPLDISVIQISDPSSRTNPGTPRSLQLHALDKKVGNNKPKHVLFNSSKVSMDLKAIQEFDDGVNPDVIEAYASQLAVDSLEIHNSTHITRVKDNKLRRAYKETYPFINFKRPNIRGIIYGAASNTISKDICVVTSGPKGMVNECKRWAAEIGVDVHSEVFDW